MHFVTKEYDDGPIFLESSVPIYPDDTWESVQDRVNEKELELQPLYTNMVINGRISWDGYDRNSLKKPAPLM